jgi:hypothetical protein
MNARVPFPAVPASLGERWRSASLRPFGGDPSDLGVDFGGPRQAVVSALLACCAEAADGSPFAAAALDRLRLGARIEGLLRLVILAGVEVIPQLLRCDACGADVELDLPLAALADRQREVGELDVVAVSEEGDDGGLRVRLPTAEDLAAWAAEPGLELDESAMLRRLVVGGSPGRAEVAAIEAALAAADPLVDFRVDFGCPECQAMQRAACDLEGLALARLEGAQARLLDEVHRLARAYHWSEAAILSLPAWRRRAYLARLDAEARG